MRLRDYDRVVGKSLLSFRQFVMKKAFLSEDRQFRECFGCGADVVLKLWRLLEDKDHISTKGTLEHLLRALTLMKVYPTEYIFSSLTGKLDPKTNRLWNWKIIYAVADLEPYLVSNSIFYLYKKAYNCAHYVKMQMKLGNMFCNVKMFICTELEKNQY